jgi:hypothetical protein
MIDREPLMSGGIAVWWSESVGRFDDSVRYRPPRPVGINSSWRIEGRSARYTFGAPIGQADAKVIADYLTKNYRITALWDDVALRDAGV